MSTPPPIKPDKLLLTTAEVVERLNISRATFYRWRKALDAVGFPRPLPAMKSRYDLAAITEWLARQRDPGLTREPRPVRPNGLPVADGVKGRDRAPDRRLPATAPSVKRAGEVPGQPGPPGPDGMLTADEIACWNRELDRRLSDDRPLPKPAKRFADPVRETARLLRLRETNPEEFNTKAPKN